ncbi:hypothetical protein [Actinocrispum sp. NPDC049592]|uniref:hypothetical protein n=1 Tax=Actinocrispum sp. NPDC049592 TaxID=3154835 RepID=UPI0034368806
MWSRGRRSSAVWPPIGALLVTVDPAPRQACQAAHAPLDFALTHPGLLTQWHKHSNTLVVLAARDELALTRCFTDAVSAGLRAVAFHQPDIGGALTAVALEPRADRLVAHLPTLDQLGRSLTAAEFRGARDEIADRQLVARIGDPDTT